jgi:hypothetical protein
MRKFTISVGQVKQANNSIVNSNKLKHVFYNIGNKFICNEDDFGTIIDILDRKMIKIKA